MQFSIPISILFVVIVLITGWSTEGECGPVMGDMGLDRGQDNDDRLGIDATRQRELMKEYAGVYRTLGKPHGGRESELMRLDADGGCSAYLITSELNPVTNYSALSIANTFCEWKIVGEVVGSGVRYRMNSLLLVRDPQNVMGTSRCPDSGCYLNMSNKGIITVDGTLITNEADYLTDYGTPTTPPAVLNSTMMGGLVSVAANLTCYKVDEEYVVQTLHQLGADEKLVFPEFPDDRDLAENDPTLIDRERLMKQYAGFYRTENAYKNQSSPQIARFDPDGSCKLYFVDVDTNPVKPDMPLAIRSSLCDWRIVDEVPSQGIRFTLTLFSFLRDPEDVFQTGRCPATGCYGVAERRGIMTSDGRIVYNEAEFFTDYGTQDQEPEVLYSPLLGSRAVHSI